MIRRTESMRGKLPDRGARCICIEGGRAATSYGEFAAVRMAQDLTEAGFTVVTQGGFGIGAAVLRGALAVGGKPIVVPGGGADVAFPVAHGHLFDLVVAAGGSIVSAQAEGTRTSRAHLHESREMIVEFVEAVVVIEGSLRSGTAYMAEVARASGRPLFAVPGPVTSSVSALPHRLIREGVAVLVTDAQDVVDSLGDARSRIETALRGES